jgi:Transposase DDE domain/Insertion element 4 transposase N-terminal
MALKTPFFSAFGPLLFGRSKTAVRKSLQRLERLEDLYAIFGDLFPERLLDPTAKGANSRRRSLPAVVTFWAFVAQVLSPKTSCREIARRVEVWWRWGNLRTASAVTPEAFCRARQRLRADTLDLIAGQIAWNLERRVLQSERLLPGRDVKIIDGTGISLPDTPENQAIWPQPKGQKPGCGFPVLKMAGLFSLASGALLAHVTGRQTTHDSRLFHELWPQLKKGDVILGDRAFCSYPAMVALHQRGIDTLVRLHQFRPADMRRGRRLGTGDQLVVWTKAQPAPEHLLPDEFASLPEQLPVRLIRTLIAVPGFRTREVTLATTLIDAALYPAELLRELYARRWNIELHFAQIKTLLEMDVLRCQSPAMIEKELQVHLIAYNLVRSLMQQAAQLHDLPLERISFKGSLDALRHSAQAIHASAHQPRKQAQLINRLLESIACDPIPHRPGRAEPRARKRRPKNYQLLTHPRREMKVINHRNKHRAIRPNSALS